MAEAAAETKTRTGSVQSIERAFSVLEMMADAGGTLPLSHLANQSGLPLPTIHRLLRTLVDLGYIRQESSRQYTLGPRLIRLGDVSARMLSVWARPYLASSSMNWVNRQISRCSTATRSSTSRRHNRGIPCGCSPKMAVG